MTIGFESLVQDYKRVFTQCSVSAAWRIFDLLCQASWVRPRIFPRERLVCFRYNTLKTWWGLCFTTTLTLLNSHKALTTSTYSWSACRRRASSLNASYDTSLYLAYQVGRYHLTRFSVYWGGMGWAIPCYAKFSTRTPQPESPTAASRDSLLRVYLSQLPQIGGRGLCSHRPLSVCVL